MKIHLRNSVLKADDFRQSPHVFEVLQEGTFAACQAGCCPTEFITSDPEKVTCKACQEIIQNPT